MPSPAQRIKKVTTITSRASTTHAQNVLLARYSAVSLNDGATAKLADSTVAVNKYTRLSSAPAIA